MCSYRLQSKTDMVYSCAVPITLQHFKYIIPYYDRNSTQRHSDVENGASQIVKFYRHNRVDLKKTVGLLSKQNVAVLDSSDDPIVIKSGKGFNIYFLETYIGQQKFIGRIERRKSSKTI